MLTKVPSYKVIVNEYHKLPFSGARPMTDNLRKAVGEKNKPKREYKMKGKNWSF